MTAAYTQEQKDLVALFGDLLGNPLSPREKAELRDSLEAAGGNLRAAQYALDPQTAAHVQDLMSQGIALSLALEKLGQRGVSILFPKADQMRRVRDLLTLDPPLLFAVGSEALLEDARSPLSLSLDQFEAAGCAGVLLADRPLDALLRIKQVASAIRSKRAIVVTDRLGAPAAVKRSAAACPSPAPEAASVGHDAAPRSLPERHVFVSGSRSQALIPEQVQASLDAIVRQGIGILIGDSDKGVDSQVADFLRAPLYERVTIYTISERPRIMPEQAWGVRVVPADLSLKPQQRQMAKDREMARAADWGLAILNPIERNRRGALQVSSGTLRNVIQMLLEGKKVKLFYRFEGGLALANLGSLSDLESVIDRLRTERLDDAEAASIRSARGVSPEDDPPAVKHEKVRAKYEELLRAERRLLAAGAPSEPEGYLQPSLFEGL